MKNVLNIIGSDDSSKSVSYRLSKIVESKIFSKEFRFTSVTVEELLSSKVKLDSNINDLYNYDNIILYAPLYIGGFSAKTIRFLEILAENKKSNDKVPYFSVVINSNLQMEDLGKYTISSVKIFSDYMGFKWQRGIQIALEQSIETKNLGKLGGSYEAIDKELLMFCADIVNEKQAFGINSVPPYLPKKLWVVSNNIYWRRLSLKNKVFNKINAKPYKQYMCIAK